MFNYPDTARHVIEHMYRDYFPYEGLMSDVITRITDKEINHILKKAEQK